MVLPLMPQATAVWLVENTALTFEQIAEFCGLHALEVQGIADGEVAAGMRGADPITGNQLTQEEITRCEGDAKASLRIAETARQYVQSKVKGARYTPVSKRQDKPDAIAWLVKSFPSITDAQISKLIGTTKNTIQAVRTRTHRNQATIKPRDPVTIGLCSQTHLDELAAKLIPAEPEGGDSEQQAS